MRKFYKLTFLDGHDVLVHYGVKGMRWGEWNEETKERYGIRDDDGGLSQLKAFRETSYVLPKGSSVERYASLKESRKGTDLSKPFYAISNEYDHNQYGSYLDDLPSAHETGLFGRVPNKMGLVRMSAVDDMTVARGSFVIEQLTGEKPKYLTPGSPHHTFDTGADDWRKGDSERATIHELAKTKLQDSATLDRFRRMGYDAIEDVEDQTMPLGRGYIPAHPLIVLNGDRVSVNRVDKFKKDRPPSWDDTFQHSTLPPEEVKRRRYAFPDKRKFPLPDRAHVLSAIRFFNYVSPKDEKHLANAILKRMRELGMSEVNVGDNNRFGKYYKPKEVST